MATQKQTIIEEIDIKELLLSVLRKWYIFVIIGIFALPIAFYLIKTTSPLYSTEGTIIVQPENEALSVAMKQFSLASVLFNSKEKVDDEIIILRSKNISQQMVELLDLQTNSYYKKDLGKKIELYKNEPIQIIYPENFKKNIKGSFTIKINKRNNTWNFLFTQKIGYKKFKHKEVSSNLSNPINTPWGEFTFVERPEFIDNKYTNYKLEYQISPLKSRVEQYNKRLNISLSGKKANAISISFVGGNITKNETIINTTIELYQQFKFEQKKQNIIKLEAFITERLNFINKELNIIEKNIENFRINNNLADIKLQSESALESSREYNKLITEVDMESTVMSFIEKFLLESEDLELIPTNTGITDEVLSKLIITHNNDVIEYLRLTRSTTESNPYAHQLKEKIVLSRKNILQTITNMKEGAILRRQDIIKKYDEFNKQINDVPSIEREYIAITREQEIKNQLYLFLLQKREEIQFAMTSTNMNDMVVDKAYTFEKSVSQSPKVTLLMALIITALLGLIYIYVESLFDNKIQHQYEINQQTSVPIIGIVPKSKFHKTTDIFRNIRTNLQLANKFTPENKTFLITSTNGHHGIDFISANLAISFANLKRKTILLDFNMHNSKIHKLLTTNKSTGLFDYLEQECDIDSLIQPYQDNKYLSIIPAGVASTNSTDLIDSDLLKTLFAYLKDKYECIIINTPSIYLLPDALLLDKYADNVLFIFKKNSTRKSDLKKLNSLVKDQLLHNVSIIYNCNKNSI